MSAQDEAADLLIFYMRAAWEAAGLNWEPDNSTEIKNLADRLGAAAKDAARDVVNAHLRDAPHIHRSTL